MKMKSSICYDVEETLAGFYVIAQLWYIYFF